MSNTVKLVMALIGALAFVYLLEYSSFHEYNSQLMFYMIRRDSFRSEISSKAFIFHPLFSIGVSYILTILFLIQLYLIKLDWSTSKNKSKINIVVALFHLLVIFYWKGLT